MSNRSDYFWAETSIYMEIMTRLPVEEESEPQTLLELKCDQLKSFLEYEKKEGFETLVQILELLKNSLNGNIKAIPVRKKNILLSGHGLCIDSGKKYEVDDKLYVILHFNEPPFKTLTLPIIVEAKEKIEGSTKHKYLMKFEFEDHTAQDFIIHHVNFLQRKKPANPR